MTITPPKVAIITVNFNQTDATADLLKSLRAFPYSNQEVWVVDNGSANPPVELSGAFPEVNFIFHPENIGFAAGNNLAVKKAKADYYFFLNNDTELKNEVTQHLVNFLEEDVTIGGVSPLIKFYQQPEIIQYAGATEMTSISIRNHSIGYTQKDEGQFSQPTQTAFLHGAAMMIRSEAIVRAGLMFEDYFLYYEEYDWCARLKKAGYDLWMNPRYAVYHKESLSAGKNSPLKTYYLNRNRRLWARRNLNLMYRMLSGFYFYVVAFPKNLLNFTVHRQWSHLRALCRGVFWNLFH